MRSYEYVGDPSFIPKGAMPPRLLIDCLSAVVEWMTDHESETDICGEIAATFVVDEQEQFWVADRATEHVACARLGKVLSAGEVFFATNENGAPCIERITNQSTGFCPEPLSWKAVVSSLHSIGMSVPDGFDPAFEFRRCPKCSTLAIIKGWEFTCLVCGTDLPAEWNIV